MQTRLKLLDVWRGREGYGDEDLFERKKTLEEKIERE